MEGDFFPTEFLSEIFRQLSDARMSNILIKNGYLFIGLGGTVFFPRVFK